MTACIAIANPAIADSRAKILQHVTVSPAFFNPSIGQKETITFSVAKPGKVSARILDRDHFAIRHFAARTLRAASATFQWDGKDDAGVIVPDEAYSIALKFQNGKSSETYDPATGFRSETLSPTKRGYSRSQGVLTYTLAEPSRVHAQAGEAVTDPKTKEVEGPVLKTIVDREPRVAGSIVETWNGFDESGTISVGDLPHFVVSIMATSLPKNSILTVGNRTQSFPEYAIAHRSGEATRPRPLQGSGHGHHVGLSGLEDRTPRLRLDPSGNWNPGDRTWNAQSELDVRAEIEGPHAPYFLSQPGNLDVYLDGKRVRRIKNAQNPERVKIEVAGVSPGEHRVALNWISEFGDVAVNSFKISVAESEAKR